MAQLPINQQLVVELLKETISLRTALHRVKKAIPGTYRRQPYYRHPAELKTYTNTCIDIGVYENGQVFWNDEYRSNGQAINNHADLDEAIEEYLRYKKSADLDLEYQQIIDEVSPLLDNYGVLDEHNENWIIEEDGSGLLWTTGWLNMEGDPYDDEYPVRIHLSVDENQCIWITIDADNRYITCLVTCQEDIIATVQEMEPRFRRALEDYQDYCSWYYENHYEDDEDDEDELVQSA